MKFGAFFVGQRPLLHEQYADESKVNPNPVSRTDVEGIRGHSSRRGTGRGIGFRLGMDSRACLQRAQHHQLAPHSLLAAIAARTKRVKVGVACTIVPWHPPLRVGPGPGDARHHQPRPPHRWRRARLPEARVRRLRARYRRVPRPLRGGHGYRHPFLDRRHLRLRRASISNFPKCALFPKPVQQPYPPIYMAVTHSPESVEIAVSNRWGLFTVGSSFFPASPDSDQNLINLYCRRMMEEGVAADDIEVAAVRNVYVAPTDEEAVDLLTPRLQWAGDMSDFLRRPLSDVVRAAGVTGYEHYVQDPLHRARSCRGTRQGGNGRHRKSRESYCCDKGTGAEPRHALHQLSGCRWTLLRPSLQFAPAVL